MISPQKITSPLKVYCDMFFVEGMGWHKANLLEKGMVLLNREGLPYLTVLDQYSTGKLETIYNIKVEDFSTYHIGHLGVWVHNANCCDFVNTYGDIMRTPASHPEDFTKKEKKRWKNKYTGEIWEKSDSFHSDNDGEWKVGINGEDPKKRRKITIGVNDGKIIKIDRK